MKKHAFTGTLLFLAIGVFSQINSMSRYPDFRGTKIFADYNYGSEREPLTKRDVKRSSVFPVNKTSANTWQKISASMNIYGMILSYCKPLQWNDELDAVSFIHRKSPTYQISPTPASTYIAIGGIVAFVSLDCGVQWDSTAVYANDTFWARFPNGAIYNPPGNTNINNAYIVGAGPTTGTPVATLGGLNGNWYASKKLGLLNYNNAPSTVPGAQQIMPTAGPFSPGVPSRHDFSAFSFCATDDGKMRILADVSNDATMSDTSVMLMTGIFNPSTLVFDWTGKVFDPPTTIASNGVENMVSYPLQAWNEQGTIGYVVIMGSRLGATGSNVGYQPIVYKTLNSGVTWSLENAINFNSPAYAPLKRKLWNVSANDSLVVPLFFWGVGMDATVDANNKLHIFTSPVGHTSVHPDSLSELRKWSVEDYAWPHAPVKPGGYAIHPYLYDFIYDGTAIQPGWSYHLIDSMSTEGAGTRLQMSRTPDGQHLLYSWTDSDTAYTDHQKKWNDLPNIKVRLFDVADNALLANELDMTSNGPSEIANHAMYQFVSPKFKLVSKSTNSITINVPMTISNSSPFSALTPNLHWYSCASGTVSKDIVGINKNSLRNENNFSIYPNPARDNVNVEFSLSDNSKIQIRIINSIGQMVKTISTAGQTGENVINIEVKELSVGIYCLEISDGKSNTSKKLVMVEQEN